MTKKFLFVTMAIALAFGMMVSGCKEPDNEGFLDRTINLSPVNGESAIILTVKGATWKNFTGSGAVDTAEQELLGEKLLDWTSSSIDKYLYMNKEYTLIEKNKLKITFSKYTLAGVGIITGTGTIKIKNLSALEITTALLVYMDGITVLPDWAVGKNDPVTITIR